MTPAELIESLERHFQAGRQATLTDSQLRQHWTHDACTDCLGMDCRGGNHGGCIGPPGDKCACPCHVRHAGEQQEHEFSEEPDAVYPHLTRARCSCGWTSGGYSRIARTFWDAHLAAERA